MNNATSDSGTQSFLCRSRFRGCDDLRVLLAGELSKIGKRDGAERRGRGKKGRRGREDGDVHVSRGFD